MDAEVGGSEDEAASQGASSSHGPRRFAHHGAVRSKKLFKNIDADVYRHERPGSRKKRILSSWTTHAIKFETIKSFLRNLDFVVLLSLAFAQFFTWVCLKYEVAFDIAPTILGGY